MGVDKIFVSCRVIEAQKNPKGRGEKNRAYHDVTPKTFKAPESHKTH